MDLDKIILNVLNNKASKEEYETLEAWRNESKENLEFLNQMKAKVESEKPGYQQYDTEKAWKNVDAQIGSSMSPTTRWIPKFALAGLFLILIGAFAYYMTSDSSGPELYKSENEVLQFATKDNSSIWLNRNSQLAEVSDFTSTREVNLKGEAYFDVVSDKDNPFVINISNDEFIRVIGTSFNVLNRGQDFDLAVYSGHVQLHVLDRVIDLYKNDRVKRVNGSYVKVTNKDKNILSWKNKVLIFENEKLENVFDELETYYNVNINVEPTVSLETCELRSRFDNQALDSVLKEFKTLFDLTYTQDGQDITITSLKCD